MNQFSDVQSETLIARARLNTIEQSEGVVARQGCDVEIGDRRHLLGESCQFVKVGRKECTRLDALGNMSITRKTCD